MKFLFELRNESWKLFSFKGWVLSWQSFAVWTYFKKSNSEARQRRSMGKIFWEIYQVHARNFGYDVTYVRSPVQTRLILQQNGNVSGDVARSKTTNENLD